MCENRMALERVIIRLTAENSRLTHQYGQVNLALRHLVNFPFQLGEEY
jgi:hypothetical protein